MPRPSAVQKRRSSDFEPLETSQARLSIIRALGAAFLESFRFYEDDDYENEIFSILSSAFAWTSDILAENVIAFAISLRVLARMS